MTDPIPEVPRQTVSRNLMDRVSLVWLVPIAALLIAMGVAYNSWAERGPVIRVTFENLSGVVANETELRFRDVAVGIVEQITFPATLDSVTAHIRLDGELAQFVDSEASFWIVRPEVTTSGISGLDTVLSGVYIQGLWDAEVADPMSDFQGLEQAPLAALGEDGLLIELRSPRDSGMTENTPILFKGIEVGRIGPAEISRDGQWVFADAIIFEPHAGLVSTATRFWDTSGFRFTIGASGAELDFNSLASLVSGGITFDTLVSGGRRLQDGAVFEVYPDETIARNSIFEDSDGSSITVSTIFSENVSGLTAGAVVEWRGVKIGEVANVTGLVDPERFGDERVRLISTLEIRPARFGLGSDLTDDEVFTYLEQRIADGLRARLATASILTGGLKVELVLLPDASPGNLDRSVEPFPLFPTAPSNVEDVAATAEGLLERLNGLPIETLLQSAIAFLDGATAVVDSPDLREAPAELRGLLADARAVVGSEDVQGLPADMGLIVEDIRSVTERLATLLDTVEAEDGVSRVLAAIDAAGSAAAGIEEAATGVPDLITRLASLSERIESLPLGSLVDNASTLVSSAEDVINDPATRALPADLQRALAEVTEILRDIGDQETVSRLNAVLASAGDAAAAIETSVSGVPALVQGLEDLSARAAALPLETLIDEISRLAGAARTIAEDPETQALPGDLRAAVADLGALLNTVEEDQTISRLGAALDAARDAARDVGAATAGVPGLVDRLQSLAARIEDLPMDRLSAELADVLAEAEELIRQSSAAELPRELAGAMSEIGLALSELREGGLIDSANATLAATERAADAVAEAADDLPGAVQRLSRLLDEASATLSAYSEQSSFNRQTVQTLREVEQAAKAVESLSRALERRPNSIILGR